MTGSRVYGNAATNPTTALWQVIRDAMDNDEVPEPELQKELRDALVAEYGKDSPDYHERRIALSVYLNDELEELYDPHKAWAELQNFMADLHIDHDDLARRVKEEKAASQLDTSAALSRRAARFKDQEPNISYEDLSEADVEIDKTHEEREWLPLDDLPAHTRDLVRLGRERVEDLSDIEIPEYVQAFLNDGEIAYSSENPPREFWNSVRKLFTMEIGVDGEIVYTGGSPEILELIYAAIEKEEKWDPIEEIPAVSQDLVMASRFWAIVLYGGNLSWHETEDGWESSHKRHSNVRSFLENGLIRADPPNEFLNELRQLLFKDDLQEFAKLARPVIEWIEDWTPIAKVPKYMHKLVEMVRTKAVELYGGRITGISGLLIGKQKFYASELQKLVSKGRIKYSKDCAPSKLWFNVRKAFFRTAMGADGKFITIYEPLDVMDYIYPIIEKMEEWIPIEQIPKVMQELVREARMQMAEVFGGRFPSAGFTTIDGWKSRYLHSSPVLPFLKNGLLKYSTNNKPHSFFNRLRETVFGIERLPDGTLSRIEIPERIKTMLDRLEAEAMEAWEKSAQNQYSFLHPGISDTEDTDKKDGSGSGSPAPTTPAGNASVPVLPASAPSHQTMGLGHLSPVNLFPAGSFAVYTTGSMMGWGITARPIR